MTFLFINKDYVNAQRKLDRRRKGEQAEIQTATQIFDAKVKAILDESQRRADERNRDVRDGTSKIDAKPVDVEKVP